ncbi:SGNH/GDSL hydrolase family protein [Sorangium sp. So ce131]|uniref:SGNH/GDSL hydrolase family protein n=1 Tax=Sorangium sp. So ce131 TaxID=3133282 RepID=UPI003F5FE365
MPNKALYPVPLSDHAASGAGVVLAWLGDSNGVGYPASQEAATGSRVVVQRALIAHGIPFRMVGRGFGALNGTGQQWGRYPLTEDLHDSPATGLWDWRHNCYTGRRLVKTTTVTGVNTSTGTITAPGHTLLVGDPFYLTSTGATPTYAVAQQLVYAATVNGNDIQPAQYEGGSAIGVLTAGSGTITLCEGLADMLPAIVASWDATPTDVIVMGGTNDVIALIDAGSSEADALAACKTRELTYEALLDNYCPGARKYRWSVMPVTSGVTNQAAKESVRSQLNTWLASEAVPARGGLWTFVHATARIGAPQMQGDGLHPYRAGYQLMGQDGARPIITAVGQGPVDERFPQPFVRRQPQACVELRAPTDRIAFPAQPGLNPGANAFFLRVDFMPFEVSSGTRVIAQLESPYSNGMLLAARNSNVVLYWKSASPCIPVSNFTPGLQRFRHSRLFLFCDPAGHAAVFANGQLLQRVQTTAAAITSSAGLYLGGVGGLDCAPGLYQSLIFGHGAGLTIEAAARMAWRDYVLGEDPTGTTAKFDVSEGTGTAIGGKVVGSTAATLTVSTGGWVAGGRYKRPWDEGYVRPAMDQQLRTITGAYQVARDEYVKYSAGSYNLILPDAQGNTGARVILAEVGNSSTPTTILAKGGETVEGGASLVVSTPLARTRLICDGLNWSTW